MSNKSVPVTGFCEFANEQRTVIKNFIVDYGMTENTTIKDRPDVCPNCTHYNECPLLKD